MVRETPSPAEVTLAGQLRAAAPPGRQHLDGTTVRHLQKLTGLLLAERGDSAAAEHDRFLAIRARELCLPRDELGAALCGAVVLVTGGTGCVWSALIGQLAACWPARVVSVSRGSAYPWRRYGHAEYRTADIRDESFTRVAGEVRPDVIFHVAGQRDPGLAEVEVHRTVTTNVFGTRNVVRAAQEAGARVVCAGTGKALRPFSPDIYTASKRAAEWVAAGAGVPVSGVRFTHIADNSIVYRRVRDWAAGGVIRLHSPDVSFYVQSAVEAAQLMLLAALDGRVIRAIRDLGWPVSLLDLSLGVLAAAGSDAPVYISGYDRGYEEVPFPGLYDPQTASDVSPLLNAVEAAAVVPSACPMTDAFSLPPARESQSACRLDDLSLVCSCTQDPEAIRAALRALSWVLLEDTLAAAPRPVLTRMAALTRRAPGLCADYRRILRLIEDSAGR